jgi:hypothetical protein
VRLGVFGNCQAQGFAASLAALVPSAEVVVIAREAAKAAELARPDLPDRWSGLLRGFDIVFIQDAVLRWGPVPHDALAAQGVRVSHIPVIGFEGLHPDCVHLHDAAGMRFGGAIRGYNSALSFACFLEGIDPERAERLFNSYVFASLGYFDLHGLQLATMREKWDALGFDLPAALAEAPPVFMLTVNHPVVGLLFALARQALRRVGLPMVSAAPPEDHLAQGPIWPVYPEIAARLGVPGGLRFRAGRRVQLDLPDFVRGSYAAYAARDGIRAIAAPPAVIRARNLLRAEILGLPPFDPSG